MPHFFQQVAAELERSPRFALSIVAQYVQKRAELRARTLFPA